MCFVIERDKVESNYTNTRISSIQYSVIGATSARHDHVQTLMADSLVWTYFPVLRKDGVCVCVCVCVCV